MRELTKMEKDLANLLAEAIIQDEFADILMDIPRDSVAGGIELLLSADQIDQLDLASSALTPIIKRRMK